jgi:hypothetical protein
MYDNWSGGYQLAPEDERLRADDSHAGDDVVQTVKTCSYGADDQDVLEVSWHSCLGGYFSLGAYTMMFSLALMIFLSRLGCGS